MATKSRWNLRDRRTNRMVLKANLPTSRSEARQIKADNLRFDRMAANWSVVKVK